MRDISTSRGYSRHWSASAGQFSHDRHPGVPAQIGTRKSFETLDEICNWYELARIAGWDVIRTFPKCSGVGKIGIFPSPHADVAREMGNGIIRFGLEGILYAPRRREVHDG